MYVRKPTSLPFSRHLQKREFVYGDARSFFSRGLRVSSCALLSEKSSLRARTETSPSTVCAARTEPHGSGSDWGLAMPASRAIPRELKHRHLLFDSMSAKDYLCAI